VALRNLKGPGDAAPAGSASGDAWCPGGGLPGASPPHSSGFHRAQLRDTQDAVEAAERGKRMEEGLGLIKVIAG